MKYNWIVLLCCYDFFIIIILIFGQIARADHHGSSASVVGAIVDDSCRVGKEERVAMKMALQDFHDHQPDTNRSLTLHIRRSRSDPMQTAQAARHLITKKGIQAILGSHTWEETSLVAKVGSENHVPILSFANANKKWATELWPFLVQFSPNNLNQTKSVAAIVQSWEWYQVSVIYEENSSMINDILPHLSTALQEVGAKISHLAALPPFVSSSLAEELERLKGDQCRVFVVHSSFEFALKLFAKAREMKMMEKEYVWITTDAITNLVHSFNASTFSSMQGVVGFKSYINEDEPCWQDFYHKFRKRFSSEYLEEYNHEPGIFAAQAYDATWTLALAMKGNDKEGKELLAQILKSDFYGVSRKVQFNNQGLAPEYTFQIINVVGKSYRELGFWSDQFGFSKSIGESTSYKSSMTNLGQVFWPGGPWYTPKGWTIPTISNPLRIGVPNSSFFKHFLNVEQGGDDDHSGNNNFSFSGFAIEVFKATVEKLPFCLPYNFLPFNGTYNELVEQIHLKKFDGAVGDITVVAARYKQAEFTHPYTETGLVMVVPIQWTTSNKAWLFLQPFKKSMWVLIVVVNIYNGFVVWLIERNYCPELKGSKLNQIGTLFWLAFSTLFSLHGDKLHSNLSRMTMLAWLFVALVITQTYTANLTSMLTVQQLEPDVGALQRSNAMFGYSRGSYLKSYLREVLGIRDNKMKEFSSPEGFAQALQRREIAAAFLEASLAKLFLAKYCKGFTKLGQIYKVGGFGFAFRKGSPLLPSINRALLEVTESGKLLELENSMLEAEKCMDMETDNDSGPPSLGLKSFWVLFVFTISTSTVALLIYSISLINKSMFKLETIWWLMMLVMKPRSINQRRDT